MVASFIVSFIKLMWKIGFANKPNSQNVASIFWDVLLYKIEILPTSKELYQRTNV